MNNLKNRLIEELIEREGGYVNDPTDRGGETMYGITLSVARENGYKGSMRDLPYELAFKIYQDRYWTPLKLDDICRISETLTEQLFDFGVNSGVNRAGKCLQQVLNVLNNRQTLYPDLVADGIVGSRSLYALNKYVEHRKQNGLKVLIEAVRGMRISFCINIAVKDENQEKYQFGWLQRVVHL
ncbi:glycoside hydrolase family 108 protein [Shewanella halifaxensis]|uniref:glycoside hydrolase family 108 protein n=1 Tax=Shewanella halifaxensis TaxID=271098 RepID=UPI000D591144|nr:N-acetylmuramidase [Shewanella halifaxensis]